MEDVFPIEHGGIRGSYVSLAEGNSMDKKNQLTQGPNWNTSIHRSLPPPLPWCQTLPDLGATFAGQFGYSQRDWAANTLTDK